MDKTTHFGYENVPESMKSGRVAKVFESVAGRYDVMNDLMSAGLHRAWKRFALALSGVEEGGRVLDAASGTGDLAKLFSQRVGPLGEVVMTDINGAMLRLGRDRMLDAGIVAPALQCDAEQLPFADGSFDCVSIGFGLRNVTRKELALKEMHRVLRPGGRLLVLEFSHVWKPLQAAYDFYSFQVLPRIGQWVAKDAKSYRYLAESIRMHPDQETLKSMMEEAGLQQVQYFNLSAGVVAVHRGVRI